MGMSHKVGRISLAVDIRLLKISDSNQRLPWFLFFELRMKPIVYLRLLAYSFYREARNNSSNCCNQLVIIITLCLMGFNRRHTPKNSGVFLFTTLTECCADVVLLKLLTLSAGATQHHKEENGVDYSVLRNTLSDEYLLAHHGQMQVLYKLLQVYAASEESILAHGAHNHNIFLTSDRVRWAAQ